MNRIFFCVLMTACGSSMGNIPENCEIRHDGVCYMHQSEACEAAGCPGHCLILETYPGQVECEAPPVSAQGTAGPVDENGIPENCNVRVGDECYLTSEEACAAAECPLDRCSIMESYPGQVHCQPE